MELILEIAFGILILTMLFFLWPAYKQWRSEKHEAQAGDWGSVIFALSLVVLFVLLLILSVM